MKLENLIKRSKKWIERDHTGELQVGHFGICVGCDNSKSHTSKIYMRVSTSILDEKNGGVWINVMDNKYDINHEMNIPDETVKEIIDLCKKSRLNIVRNWDCSRGNASHSFVGVRWKVHPTTVKMCESIKILRKPRMIT